VALPTKCWQRQQTIWKSINSPVAPVVNQVFLPRELLHPAHTSNLGKVSTVPYSVGVSALQCDPNPYPNEPQLSTMDTIVLFRYRRMVLNFYVGRCDTQVPPIHTTFEKSYSYDMNWIQRIAQSKAFGWRLPLNRVISADCTI
jgi:hypothetical protein